MADGSKITSKKARPRLGASAQARWMRRQQEKGNCRACGKQRPPELKQLCRECQDKTNAYMKRYRSDRRNSAKVATASPSAKAIVDVSPDPNPTFIPELKEN